MDSLFLLMYTSQSLVFIYCFGLLPRAVDKNGSFYRKYLSSICQTITFPVCKESLHAYSLCTFARKN